MKVKFNATRGYTTIEGESVVYRAGEVYDVSKEDLNVLGDGFEVVKVKEEPQAKEVKEEQKTKEVKKAENKMIDNAPETK